MSRKHKSRKPKITQSNIPLNPVAKEKKQVETAAPNPTLPEKPQEAVQPPAEPPAVQNSEATPPVQPAPQPHQPDEGGYSLDAHYAAQEASASVPQAAVATSESAAHQAENQPNQNETTDTHTGSLNAEAAASLNEYEQLKRKNRRRLVGAGALVLVAGSLFAAASKDSPQSNPQLNNNVKVVQQAVQPPEILRPAGSENPIDLSMDDDKGAPLVLKNNAMSSSGSRSQANANANMNANHSTHTATPAAPRSHAQAKPSNPIPNITPAAQHHSSNNSADRAKAREEARLAEERRRKAQSRAAEAEAKRLETERAIASRAKAAQAAAERSRNAERAQLTAERAAEEKQRAQRQAAIANSKSSNTASTSGGNKSSIQAGAFSDREAARRMQQQLKNLNYAARVEEVQTSKGKMYRVRTGNFSNQTDAKDALNKLQNKGVNAMVVGK